MTVQELYEALKANLEGEPALANQDVKIAWRSLKGCRQRCLLDIDEIYFYGETMLLLGEDRA